MAIVRNPAKAQALAAQGITVRQADYGDEAALTSALQGVEKLLLISSSEVGQRAPQHRNVINAAKAAGVKFIAYTSLLHADTSPLGLADEHIETEKMLADSGIVYTLSLIHIFLNILFSCPWNAVKRLNKNPVIWIKKQTKPQIFLM